MSMEYSKHRISVFCHCDGDLMANRGWDCSLIDSIRWLQYTLLAELYDKWLAFSELSDTYVSGGVQISRVRCGPFLAVCQYLCPRF